MSVWEKWRPWLQREKQLLLELALMLLVALVVGVYFLEHFSARLQAEQRVQLKALAQQTALRSAESLAGDDLIGLNVIARETRALEPVGGVQFLDVAREPVTGKSDDSLPVKVEVPVALPDGELAGSVVLAAAHDTAPRQRLETGYVLVVLGLLALRAAAEVIRRRLWRPAAPPVADCLCCCSTNSRRRAGRSIATWIAPARPAAPSLAGISPTAGPSRGRWPMTTSPT